MTGAGRTPTKGRGRALITVVASIVLLTGCAGDPEPTARETREPADPATQEPIPFCPYPHGGSCLGDLEPGDHATEIFEPRLSYTAAEPGWINAEDLPGNVLLLRESDPQTGPIGGSYVGVYRDVRAAAQNCAETAEPGIGQSPTELVAWFQSLPGVVSTTPEPVTVGELDGLAIDLTLDPSWTGTCPWSGGAPVTALVIGNGVSLLHHVLLGGLSVRLYLLEFERGNVTIEVTSVDEQMPAAEYRAAIQPLLDSFIFES